MNPSPQQPLHLNGRHYDLRQSYLKRDIPFWLRMAGRYGGPILELACGTGRITIPLAEAGFEMVGLDVSSSDPLDTERSWLTLLLRSIVLLKTLIDLTGNGATSTSLN